MLTEKRGVKELENEHREREAFDVSDQGSWRAVPVCCSITVLWKAVSFSICLLLKNPGRFCLISSISMEVQEADTCTVISNWDMRWWLGPGSCHDSGSHGYECRWSPFQRGLRTLLSSSLSADQLSGQMPLELIIDLGILHTISRVIVQWIM